MRRKWASADETCVKRIRVLLVPARSFSGVTVTDDVLLFDQLVSGGLYANMPGHDGARYLFKLHGLFGRSDDLQGELFIGGQWRQWIITSATSTMLYALTDDDKIRWRDLLPVGVGKSCPTCGR